MTITYRTASVQDASALAELGARTFSETFGHLYQPSDLELFLQNHRPEAWARELADPAFAVSLESSATFLPK